MFYSKTTNAFYSKDVNDVMPEDVVEISDALWQQLLEQQSNGYILTSDADGYPIVVPPPPPSKEKTIENISIAIQEKLDAGAQKWGYNNLVTAASYASSTNPQYKADAIALIDWRDAVWDWAVPKFATVTPGESPDKFIKTMPTQPDQPKIL